LLRTIDLGVDARKALVPSQFKLIAGWRDRSEDSVVRTCRQEAIRLAKRIVTLDGELVDNRKALDVAVAETAPELCKLPGVGSVVAASVLTAWSHPGRVRSDAAFAALARTLPIPAFSGDTLRHRLNRGRDRRLNRALTTGGHRPHAHPRTNTRLRHPTACGRPDHQGDHALTQRYITRLLYRTLTAAHVAAVDDRPHHHLGDRYRTRGVLAHRHTIAMRGVSDLIGVFPVIETGPLQRAHPMRRRTFNASLRASRVA
jgi:hypothetical protein